jgi:hypothetical protein
MPVAVMLSVALGFPGAAASGHGTLLEQVCWNHAMSLETEIAFFQP